MSAKTVALTIVIVFSGVLAWAVLNLSIENDGLKQVATSQRQSIKTLLDFTKATVRCDVKPNEITSSLKATELQRKDGAVEVATLAFKAHFRDDRLNGV